MEDPLSGILSTIDNNNDIDGIHFISSHLKISSSDMDLSAKPKI